MTKKERRQQEQAAETVLRGIFGESFKEADFCYYRGNKAVLVTYEDFKPEAEAKRMAVEALGAGWNVVVKREYSDLAIMMAMLKIFKQNRVAVVDEVDGELRPFQIREYVIRQLECQ